MRFSTLLTSLLFTLGAGTIAQAQITVEVDPAVQVHDSLKALPDSIEFIPVETDELIQDRLSCLQQEIPLEFNRHVRGFIDYFTIRNRKYTRRMLEREQVYFPLFEEYLAKHGMPLELKYLSVVESGLNPKAMSPAKAVGLWQFMTPTANDFRLVQNDYLDERMDPEKSTEAACKFLKQLHRMFGSWEMALAAYNCGPGNVKKAIARAGGKNTFWEIYPYLPKETRSYVPSFTAVVYAMNHAQDHNIQADQIQQPIEVDTVLISQAVDLKLLALQLNLAADQIEKLNPALKKKYLPENVRNFPLLIPYASRPLLDQNRLAILDSARYRAPIRPIAPLAPPTMLAQATTAVSSDSLQKSTYTVRRGDSLAKIARAKNVTIQQLKEWNDIDGSTVLANEKLIVYTPVQKPVVTPLTPEPNTLLASAEQEQANTKMSGPNAEGMQKENAAEVAVSKKKLSTAKQDLKKSQIIHSVQEGDTLWSISKRYNNINVEQLIKANKLKGNDIKPGMKLIIG